MGFGSRIRRAFSRGDWLEKVKIEELERELIQLDNQISLLSKEIQKLEEKKKKLFQQGIGKSNIEKMLLAEKIKDLDAEIKMKFKEYNKMMKQRRALSNLIRLKKWEQRLKEKGVWDKLRSYEPEKLMKLLSEVQFEDKMFETNLDKINEILGREAMQVEVDEGTKEILELWEKVEKAELSLEAVEEKIALKVKPAEEEEEEKEEELL